MEKENLINNLKIYKMIQKEHLGLPENVSFGVEIEYDGANLSRIISSMKKSDLTNDWIALVEPSITKFVLNRNKDIYGGEIVSPILYDYDSTYNEITTACNIIKNNKGFVNELCGGHIHIGSQIFGYNKMYWSRFIKMWMCYEDIIFRFSAGEDTQLRNGIYTHAKPMALEIYFNLDKITTYCKSPCHLYYHIVDLFKGDRSKAISFNNVKGTEFKLRNTVEIRCPNGTLDPIILQNNINFFTHLILFCCKEDFNEEWLDNKVKNFNPYTLKEEINYEETLELAELIYDDEISIYNFLKQYLKLNNEEELNKGVSK